MRLKVITLGLTLVIAMFIGPVMAQSAAGTPAQTVALPPWPTKAILLAATRHGDFRRLPEIKGDVEKETSTLTNAVILVLRNEYQVPPVQVDQTPRAIACRRAALAEVRRLLTAITAMHVETLSDAGPTFVRQTDVARAMEGIRTEVKNLGRGDGLCTTMVLGIEQPHAYGAALAKLADEFSTATKEWVEAERAQRVAGAGRAPLVVPPAVAATVEQLIKRETGAAVAVAKPPGIQAAGPAAQSGGPLPRWPTKVEFLAAARSGEFRGLPEIRVNQDQETEALTSSVLHILRAEYQMPPLPTDKSYGSNTCRTEVVRVARRLLTTITSLHVDSLSERPPTFTRDINTASYLDNIRTQINGMSKGGGLCTTTAMGVEKPHPYGAALTKLSDEFSAATKDFVEGERNRRLTAYADEQARIQADAKSAADAKAKREADARAVEQQRIDAERARIEAEQKRKQQQDKNRVAG